MPEQSTLRKSQENEVLPRYSSEEPPESTWRVKTTYDTTLVERYLTPLQEAQRSTGTVPVSLQTAVLNELYWYFTVDLRERAPTVIVNEPMAVVFHERVRKIMAYIHHDTIASLDSCSISLEVKHALFSYKAAACHSPVVIDAYDHDQCLVRLTYFVHGTPPVEFFAINGKSVIPTHSKYRGCWFFRRMLLRQRIVWLPVRDGKTIQVFLDGHPNELCIGEQQLFLPTQNAILNSGPRSLLAAKEAYPPGRGCFSSLPYGLTGIKIRLLRWLARRWPVRMKFGNAWVFLDRWIDADDNAEHLYRWVRQHHPEINAWFLLDRKSKDRKRLAAEGFRLMPAGWLCKLLVLNSENVFSSHAEFMNGGLNPHYYGDLMQWRYIFLQHGVIMNDLSHWLSNKPFDIFVTSSPDETIAITGDNSPYSFTTREICRTGLPRHDSLRAISRSIPKDRQDYVLVMPTWRGNLVNVKSETEANSSIYIQQWNSLLNSIELHKLVSEFGKKLVFFPHSNLIPLLKFFNIPEAVEVLERGGFSIQKIFSRAALMITDYSSVAFEMACLRRPVIYYQFDKDQFFGGDHNWREGYFNYTRDGFGPVVTQEIELIKWVQQFLQYEPEVDPSFLANMERAIPEQGDSACKKIFDRVTDLRRKVI